MKKITKIIICCLMAAIIVFTSGCSEKYSEDFNLETDCQYSYYNSVTSWNKIQSDGDGQYILKDYYIYYYNTEKNTMVPLCNKPNCLHDMETDQSRRLDCNACAPAEFGGGDARIQYYDGYIYYFFNGLEDFSLYRVSKDGSKKDKIFTINDENMLYTWLIHRGYFYYVTQTYYYGEDKDTQVYQQSELKYIKLSSNMKEDDAQVIFKSDNKHSAFGIYDLKAYKNYLCYNLTANTNDVEWENDEGWYSQIYSPTYLYNIKTGENREIPVPEGYSKTTAIGGVAFLKDKMLIKLYDNVKDVSGENQDGGYKTTIYSINYDLTDEKVWLDGVEQAKLVQTYGDYVIISDAMLQLLPYLNKRQELLESMESQSGSTESQSESVESQSETSVFDSYKLNTNVEIYSSDAKRISYFVYPINSKGNFNGFGPDGVNVDFKEDDDSWSVYELNFNDVLNLNGEEVELNCVSTRKFGPLKGLNSFVIEN